MKKAVLIFVLMLTFVFADEHYAKLEPYESIIIKSEVNGNVIEAKSNLEGKVVNGVYIRVDDKLDKLDLKHTQDSLELIKKMISVNQNILPLLKRSFEKKRQLYLKVSPLSSSSISQKESLYAAFVAAKSQYSATLEKILNLKNQKVTLEQKIDLLKDRISKKNIRAKNRYLYALNVKKGEFVNVGMPIAILKDLSRAKLTIYLSSDELKNLKSKKIYLDGKVTNLKFNKIWRVADSKNISSYKAEIVLKPIANFSKLIKVEVKWYKQRVHLIVLMLVR